MRRTRRDRRRMGPPRWFKRHEDATPCECEAEVSTVRSTTGYSDFAYFLRKCGECGHKWTAWIEG